MHVHIHKFKYTITVGPVLIAWFNICVLRFLSKSANLIIAFGTSGMGY